MARKSRAGSLPLEWKTDVMTGVVGSVVSGEFDLDLLPDEIAEILVIDSTIKYDTVPEVDASSVADMYISMDPDADDTPATEANLEDLEVFFHHFFDIETDLTTSGKTNTKVVSNKIIRLPEAYPILVGTNFAQVAVAQATFSAAFITTVYFKRRKASGQDLANILLKRR